MGMVRRTKNTDASKRELEMLRRQEVLWSLGSLREKRELKGTRGVS
jgi:hypothetical protein